MIRHQIADAGFASRPARRDFSVVGDLLWDGQRSGWQGLPCAAALVPHAGATTSGVAGWGLRSGMRLAHAMRSYGSRSLEIETGERKSPDKPCSEGFPDQEVSQSTPRNG